MLCTSRNIVRFFRSWTDRMLHHKNFGTWDQQQAQRIDICSVPEHWYQEECLWVGLPSLLRLSNPLVTRFQVELITCLSGLVRKPVTLSPTRKKTTTRALAHLPCCTQPNMYLYSWRSCGHRLGAVRPGWINPIWGHIFARTASQQSGTPHYRQANDAWKDKWAHQVWDKQGERETNTSHEKWVLLTRGQREAPSEWTSGFDNVFPVTHNTEVKRRKSFVCRFYSDTTKSRSHHLVL
jgi:hypothetical protein